MTQWIHRHQIPKIKELLNDFYNKNVGTRAGYSAGATDEEEIEQASLDFLTVNCGKLWQNITDDSNLNAEIINIFAQDFIRQFWTNRIGYDNPMAFYIKLRGFMDQWLPVWGQFYKEAVLDKNAFITSIGTVGVNATGLIHVEGKSSGGTTSEGTNDSSTKGETSGATTAITSSTSDTKGSNAKDDTSSSNTSVDTSQITNGTDTTTKNDTTTTDTQNMQVTSDTPQDRISTDFSKGGKGTEPLSAYNFNYASSAEGQHTLASADTTGKDTVVHSTKVEGQDLTSVTGENHEKGTINSTTTTNGKNDSSTNGYNYSITNGKTSLKVKNHNKQNNDTTSQSANVTKSKSRGLPLTQIAREFDEMANGAYLRIFIEAKKAGLFLGVY